MVAGIRIYGMLRIFVLHRKCYSELPGFALSDYLRNFGDKVAEAKTDAEGPAPILKGANQIIVQPGRYP